MSRQVERAQKAKALARVRRLEEALRWYADPKNWNRRPPPGDDVWSPALVDRGARAREVL